MILSEKLDEYIQKIKLKSITNQIYRNISNNQYDLEEIIELGNRTNNEEIEDYLNRNEDEFEELNSS